MRNDGLFAAVFLLSRSRPELNRAQASCCCKSLPDGGGLGDARATRPVPSYLLPFAQRKIHLSGKTKLAPDQTRMNTHFICSD